MANSFLQLGITSSEYLKALERLSFQEPTEVQRLAIPLGLDERQNIIAQAKAGTGKTLAFCSIMIERLLQISHSIEADSGPVIMILLPTRELAIQVFEFIEKLLATIRSFNKSLLPHINSGIFIGGLPLQDDRRNLKIQKVKVVVGTIGRIIALIKENSLKLNDVRMFIMDEADKLVEQKDFYKHIVFVFEKLQPAEKQTDSGNHAKIDSENNTNDSVIEPTKKINDSSLKIIPQKIQYLAFSATYPDDLKKKIEKLMGSSVFVDAIAQENNDTDGEKASIRDLNLQNISQFRIDVQSSDTESITQRKVAAMLAVLKQVEFAQAIVFYNDKRKGENIFNEINASGLTSIFIHGDQTQADRIKLMNSVRRNSTQVIICTDLLARGIDVPSIDLVINYDIPIQIETYYHRIGRTGRYGRFGLSLLLVQPQDEAFMIANSQNFIRLEQLPQDFSEVNEKLKCQKEGKQQAANKGLISSKNPPKHVYHHEFTQGIIREEVDATEIFYDESNFKYFDQNTSPVLLNENEELSGSMEEMIDQSDDSENEEDTDSEDEEQVGEQEQFKKQSKTKQNNDQESCNHSENDNNEWSFLSCRTCYRFLKESQQYLKKNFEILDYFTPSVKEMK